METNQKIRGPKLPSQDRSRERVDRILKTTARLLGATPQGDISIRTIAREADVSGGTIYQFFDDKMAIFDALGASFEESLIEAIEGRLSAELAYEDMGRYVDALMKTIDEVQGQHDGFVCILRENQRADLSDLVARVRRRLMLLVNQHLEAAYPRMPADDRQLTVSIFESTLIAVMANLPPQGNRAREPYLAAAKELIVPFLTLRVRRN